MKGTIERFRQDSIGSFGNFDIADLKLYTVERPWLNNQENISCIPAGIYNFVSFNSPKHGWIWKALYVPNRTNIEIHIANKPQEVEGCIGLGLGYQGNMVIDSEAAIELMRKTIGQSGFSVEIKNS